MAEAVDFPERNDWVGKPENQSNHQCYALPVCRMISYMSGIIPSAPPMPILTCVSFWAFNEEEITEIIKNKGVYVRHQGSVSPMNIFTSFPCFKYTDDKGNEYEEFILSEKELNNIKTHGNTKRPG